DGRLLGEIADAALRPQVHRQVGDVVLAEEDAPLVRRGQTDHHVERRGLAGAVGAEQADDLARADLDRDVLDHGPPAVDLPQVAGAQLLIPLTSGLDAVAVHPSAPVAGGVCDLPLTSTFPLSIRYNTRRPWTTFPSRSFIITFSPVNSTSRW